MHAWSDSEVCRPHMYISIHYCYTHYRCPTCEIAKLDIICIIPINHACQLTVICTALYRTLHLHLVTATSLLHILVL